MNDSDTEFVWDEILENEFDSDDEPLNLLVPEANYHVVENLSVESPGRFRWNRGNRGIHRNFPFPPKPGIHLPL